MSKRNVYRFCVRDELGKHSQVWRVWTSGNNIYAGVRGITPEYKMSFHESGECHVGLTSEVRAILLGKQSWSGKSRHYDTWSVSCEINQGESQELVDLIFPHSQLDCFDNKYNSKINWLECVDGSCASIAIFKANMEERQVIESKEREFRHLCSLPLTNGYKVILLYRLIEEKQEYLEFIRHHVQGSLRGGGEKVYRRGSFDPSSSNIRSMVWHKKDNGGRICFEASTRTNHNMQ